LDQPAIRSDRLRRLRLYAARDACREKWEKGRQQPSRDAAGHIGNGFHHGSTPSPLQHGQNAVPISSTISLPNSWCYIITVTVSKQSFPDHQPRRDERRD
jgi:hypothetical protein